MINTNKLVYKAIGLGYEGDPTSSLINIVDWIVSLGKYIPCVSWNTKNKCWKAYVYDYEYDPIKLINKIKEEKGVTSKEAARFVDAYIKNSCAVKQPNGLDYFMQYEDALYCAIEKTLRKMSIK